MLIPKIHGCIVCEGARPEAGGKWILLGFFGLAPDVRVNIPDFAKPVSLCFAFVGGPAEGQLRLAIRVIAPNGSSLPGTSEVEGKMEPGRLTSAFFMQFQTVVPAPGPGIYAVELIANEQTTYRTTFELAPVKPVTSLQASSLFQ